MKQSNHLTRYVAAVTILGMVACGVVLAFGPNGVSNFGERELIVFALCALLGELVPLKVYTRGAEGETTTSTTFAVALLIAGGIEAALVGLLLANLVADLARHKPARKIAFNMAQYAISVVAAGLVLWVLADVPRAGEFHFGPGDVPAIMAAALVFFIVNTSLVAAVIAMVEGVGIWRYLVTDWFSQASTTGLMLGLSPIIVLAADYSLVLVTLLALPLFAIHRGGRAAIAKEHQSVHDALTGLPNRVLFRDRVEQAIHAAQRSGQGCSVMLMDLNHFKEINDTLGHHQGDRLLQEVAARLRATLRASDTVARLGGDEFGVLLHGVADPVQAAIVAEGLLERLREPFEVDATTLQVGGSIGVACHPAHGADVETLIQRADIAMYAAKGASSGHAVFEHSQDHHSPRRLMLAAELRGGIERSELVLAVPAEGRPAQRPDRRRRGARALGAPHAGNARAVRVRADRGADGADHRAHLGGARRGARARRDVARARPRHLDRGQPLGALVPRRGAGRRDPGRCSPSAASRPSASSSRSPSRC